METYSVEQASRNALNWCENNKGWARICDIENVDSLYKNWAELSEKEKSYWVKQFGQYDAESAWIEFGKSPCKVPYGFITGKGDFYRNILDVPLHHNLMTVYKVS
ncbi:hypothetical protein Pryu01_01248 [Paraliobacillus ryukyuensis]|uniref:Uncharacterized protein n=1 Tax=Paraliobacillus ryukyuensis TaxID=200904 RepID=A0A366EDN3_9BACI|nr:hypothetical protein [Paraliobacillus ryukyuensis]RBO99518.1 hypothetical protein DES48_104194 [Paraliobacillus ryukyuensis]